MHKRRKYHMIWQFCAAVLMALMLTAIGGCEPDIKDDNSGVDSYFDDNQYVSDDRTEPRNADLEVEPILQTIGVPGQQAVFEGKGGAGPYIWTVSNPEYGRVESIGWSEAVYTCLKVGNNNVVVRDSEGHSAIAIITPLVDSLTISPSSVDLAAGSLYAAFSVNGGAAPYTWSVGNPGMGAISYSAGTSHSAGYTAVPNVFGVNVVTVRDAQGRTESAVVTQAQ